MPDTSAIGHEHDDAILVAAVVKGDKNAFRLLIARYEKLVVSIVFRMVGQREDTEDICQDVFLKVYEKIPGFRFQSKLSTWIGRIAYNMSINFLKKRKLLLLEDIIDARPDGEGSAEKMELTIRDVANTPVQQLLENEREEMLVKSIERLSMIQKTILELFHKQEFSLEEIADITTLPVNTVKSHLFRARKQLREEMGKY